MCFTLTELERKSISYIKTVGIREIWIYISHKHISVITFALMDDSFVSLRSRDQHVKNWFEVYIISYSNNRIPQEPALKLNSAHYAHIDSILLMTKCAWEMPTSSSDKVGLLGESSKSTTIFEGTIAEVPENALNYKLHDAGIKIVFTNGDSFLVGTGNPFTLEINHESSFRHINEADYVLSPLT